MSKEKKRYKNLSVRIAGQGREEFRAVAYLNGTTMSNLVHQWIVQAIYETKKERPEDFAAAMELLASQSEDEDVSAAA